MAGFLTHLLAAERHPETTLRPRLSSRFEVDAGVQAPPDEIEVSLPETAAMRTPRFVQQPDVSEDRAEPRRSSPAREGAREPEGVHALPIRRQEPAAKGPPSVTDQSAPAPLQALPSALPPALPPPPAERAQPPDPDSRPEVQTRFVPLLSVAPEMKAAGPGPDLRPDITLAPARPLPAALPSQQRRTHHFETLRHLVTDPVWPSLQPVEHPRFVAPAAVPSTAVAAAPTIHVTIGRIEVRAVQPAPGRAPPSRETPRGVVTLDDYLKGRRST